MNLTPSVNTLQTTVAYFLISNESGEEVNTSLLKSFGMPVLTAC